MLRLALVQEILNGQSINIIYLSIEHGNLLGSLLNTQEMVDPPPVSTIPKIENA